MKILAIETSCDETAVSILDAKGGLKKPEFMVLGNALFSQADMHAKYGGVYPNLAKREHTKNITPLLKIALKEARFLEKRKSPSPDEKLKKELTSLLAKEPEMVEDFYALLTQFKKPKIDAVAVTSGPGLEPALWVGINTAKALAIAWNLPLIPINHMEGHILSSLLTGTKKSLKLPTIDFPATALLISGGHTELVHMKDWLKYKIVGETRDDAVGEAFDKIARMLHLPYPGGPHISRVAVDAENKPNRFTFPRPMLHSPDLDFSFSGIKTSVLYTVKNIPRLTKKMISEIAFEFEEAVTEVLVAKTLKAAKKHKAKTILIGGGVSANHRIQNTFTEVVEELPEITLYIPPHTLSTDNAIMIGVAAYFRALGSKKDILNTNARIKRLKAKGTKPL